MRFSEEMPKMARPQSMRSYCRSHPPTATMNWERVTRKVKIKTPVRPPHLVRCLPNLSIKKPPAKVRNTLGREKTVYIKLYSV